MAEARELLEIKQAARVVAIKRYRELTGLGLADAKAAIDRLRG